MSQEPTEYVVQPGEPGELPVAVPVLNRPPKEFPVIELFGPTIQGEGALAGTTSHFVRFGGCDFRCRWCDSDHAVLPEKVRANSTRMSADKIAERLGELPRAEWVTLSGGNPAMHKLDEVVRLAGQQFLIAVETNGTLWKDWLGEVDMLTVSPKPPSSQMAEKSLVAIDAFMDKALLAHQYETVCLKIPVHAEPDLHFVAQIHDRFPNTPLYVSVVTEMGGLYGDFADGHVDSIDEIIARWKWVTERVLEQYDRFGPVRIFPQMHALLWGHDRGH